MKDGLGQRIRTARERADLTADQLATRLGVSAQTVYRWEWESTEPSIRKLTLVAKETGVPLSQLLTGTEEAVA